MLYKTSIENMFRSIAFLLMLPDRALRFETQYNFDTLKSTLNVSKSKLVGQICWLDMKDRVTKSFKIVFGVLRIEFWGDDKRKNLFIEIIIKICVITYVFSAS